MHNSKSRISASEVGRFVYCPYQWYYERLYGSKHLRGLRKARNEELGLSDPSQSNFVRGLKFHSEYRLRAGWPVLLRLAVGLAVLALVAAAVYLYR